MESTNFASCFPVLQQNYNYTFFTFLWLSIWVRYSVFSLFFFYSLLFRDASTSLVISHLGSLGMYQKAVYFYCCVVNVSLLSSLILILWYMNLMINGKMDRGNENPTQHLPWWLRKTTKEPQSGWSAPGFEPGTSRMRVSCVTTEPHHSVIIVLFHYNILKI